MPLHYRYTARQDLADEMDGDSFGRDDDDDDDEWERRRRRRRRTGKDEPPPPPPPPKECHPEKHGGETGGVHELSCSSGLWRTGRKQATECLIWRSTFNCSGIDGDRNPAKDKDCFSFIPDGESGYCECAGGREAAHSDCQHEPFTCQQECRKMRESRRRRKNVERRARGEPLPPPPPPPPKLYAIGAYGKSSGGERGLLDGIGLYCSDGSWTSVAGAAPTHGQAWEFVCPGWEVCRDSNETCADWAKRGECAKNPDYMRLYCMQSCNACPEPKAPADAQGLIALDVRAGKLVDAVRFHCAPPEPEKKEEEEEEAEAAEAAEAAEKEEAEKEEEEEEAGAREAGEAKQTVQASGASPAASSSPDGADGATDADVKADSTAHVKGGGGMEDGGEDDEDDEDDGGVFVVTAEGAINVEDAVFDSPDEMVVTDGTDSKSAGQERVLGETDAEAGEAAEMEVDADADGDADGEAEVLSLTKKQRKLRQNVTLSEWFGGKVRRLGMRSACSLVAPRPPALPHLQSISNPGNRPPALPHLQSARLARCTRTDSTCTERSDLFCLCGRAAMSAGSRARARTTLRAGASAVSSRASRWPSANGSTESSSPSAARTSTSSGQARHRSAA